MRRLFSSVLVVSLMGIVVAGTPRIWTDKPDYLPGETVVVHGEGFAPGEEVLIRVIPPKGEVAEEWVRADDEGRILYEYPLMVAGELFLVEVVVDGVAVAIATFTDNDISLPCVGWLTGPWEVQEGEGGQTLTLKVKVCTSSIPIPIFSPSPSVGASVSSSEGCLDEDNSCGTNLVPCGYCTVDFYVFPANSSSKKRFICSDSTNDDGIAVCTYDPGDLASGDYYIEAEAEEVRCADEDECYYHYGSAYQELTVVDSAPEAALTGPTELDEGEEGTFDASGSTGHDTPFQYAWDWNYNGTFVADEMGSEAVRNHAFADDGEYRVAVQVTDSDGSTDIATITVRVLNVAPTVDTMPGDQEVNEGSQLTGLGVGFSDPGADIHTAKVDWGDGSSENLGQVTSPFELPAHTFADDGTYTVEVEVRDDDGGVGTGKFTVTVRNVAPTVDAVPEDQEVNEGSQLTGLEVEFSDPGADTHTARVDWGDGESDNLGQVTSPFDLPAHAFADNGTYTVEVEVRDDDGGVGTGRFTVTVRNVAPTVDAVPEDQEVNEGSQLTGLEVKFSDPGADTHTARVDWGDGESDNLGQVTSPFELPAHAFADDGTYTVEVEVRDDDSGVGTGQFTVTVRNVAPTVDAVPEDQEVNEGSQLTGLEVEFSDPGADTHTARVDWGDGESDNLGQVTSPFDLPAHAFADNGTYTVEVEVRDDDSGVGTGRFTVTVHNVAPTVNVVPGDQEVGEGEELTGLEIGFSDPGADTHTARVDWGDGHTNDLGQVTSPFTLPSHSYREPFVGPYKVYTVEVQVEDDDGGVGTARFEVKVWDVGAPEAWFEVTPASLNNSTSVYFEWRGEDDHSLPENLEYSWRLDGGEWSPWSGELSVQINDLEDGEHRFELRARDEAGNISAIVSYTWETDLVPPVVDLFSPADEAVYILNSDVSVNWSVYDDGGEVEVEAWDLQGRSYDPGDRLYTGGVGQYTFTVRAKDRAGNVVEVTHTYWVVYEVAHSTLPQVELVLPGEEERRVVVTPEDEVAYRSGEEILVEFGVSDAAGEVLANAVVSCTLVRVGEERKSIMGLWKMEYDEERGVYYLRLDTGGWAPGLYELWIGFADGTSRCFRLRIAE